MKIATPQRVGLDTGMSTPSSSQSLLFVLGGMIVFGLLMSTLKSCTSHPANDSPESRNRDTTGKQPFRTFVYHPKLRCDREAIRRLIGHLNLVASGFEGTVCEVCDCFSTSDQRYEEMNMRATHA